MAATQHALESIQLREEVDENFLDVEGVLDGRCTRREECTLVRETGTYTRPPPRSNPMAGPRSHVEAWINRELFGDVAEASQHRDIHDEADSGTTGLRKHVDEYIEIVDFMRSIEPPLSYLDERYVEPGADLFISSPVGSDQGMYCCCEPQLWCFT